jgi:transketolase
MTESSVSRPISNFLDIETFANICRKEILKMTNRAGASHVASALSVIDILATIYSGALNIRTENKEESDRDIVILSKGHAASALYAALALKDFFPRQWLELYCQNNAPLGGHVTSSGVPGVELSTGSLGHGLPYGLGIALARKLNSAGGKVCVVMSDGECDEGTTWESALLANHHNLDNLLVIIDRNRIQSLTYTEETLKLEPFLDKWKAFGWESYSVDGHNIQELFELITSEQSGPKCIIAETTKGKGVGFMENSVLWHYKPPNEEELVAALHLIDSEDK